MGIALIACAAAVSLSAQSPELVFDETPPSTLAGPALAEVRPYVVRSRVAALRVTTLARAMAAPATARIALNLFDDATFAVAYERVEDSGFGHRSWVGHIAGRPLSTVTLTQKDDLVTGRVTDGATMYEILGLGGGLHRIDELDTTTMPRETDVALALPGNVSGEALAAPAVATPAAAASTVDILVYYTSTFRTQVGGAAQAESVVAQHIADANTAYQRSDVNGRLRLVGVAEIAFPEPVDRDIGLQDFSHRPDVVGQREASRADLVALLAHRFTGDTELTATCGVGYVGFSGPGSDATAFSITAGRPACRYTFAHEVGHNLGAQHAIGDPVFQPPDYPASTYPTYARGYKSPSRSFRTVMAYDCDVRGPSCPRVLNFSEPRTYEGGQLTGNAAQNNARRLNELFPSVANYRAGAPPLPPPASQPPTAPRGLQAFVTGASVRLSWLPPLTGTVYGYRITAGTQPGGSNVGTVALGPTTTQVGPVSLAPGTYYARVYAHNAASLSDASNEVPFTIVGPPAAPRNFTGMVNGNTVGFTWMPPSTGGAPQDYLLEAGSAPGAANLVPRVVVNGGAVSFPNIPPGRFYVRLRSRNGAGISTPSNEAIVVVGGGCVAPSAPLNAHFTKNGSRVGISWDAPAVGGANLVYRIEAGGTPFAADILEKALGSDTWVSATVGPGRYFVRLRAMTTCGTSPASAELDIEVP